MDLQPSAARQLPKHDEAKQHTLDESRFHDFVFFSVIPFGRFARP